MPKRLFSGDRAWKSDKIAALREESRAEYAWIYSLALCDGTFECDPKKIWAECYATVRQIDGRGGWTVGKVRELLDELTQVGLLLTQTDEQGKTWGYWYKCEDCLPPRSEWHKHQRGKGYLFSELANGSPIASHTLANGSPGFGLDLGRVGDGKGADQKSSALAALLPDSIIEEKLKPQAEGVDHNGRKRGEPGYFEKGQYLGTDPKKINNKHISKVWQSFKKESAFAVYPSKYPEKWESLVAQVSLDIIMPAFQLWCVEEGARSTTRCPAGDFSSVANKYMQMIIAPAAVKPVTSQADIDAAKVRAKAAHFEQWGLDANGNLPKSEEEPGADQF